MSVPETGVYKIISLVADVNPAASVTEDKPTFQTVRLDGPVHIWELTQQAGNLVFRFAVKDAYGYTTVEGNKVTATTDVGKDSKWRVIYRAEEDAYTISPDSALSKGWTVQSNFSADPNITIETILSTFSTPERFLPAQLFRFVKHTEE